MSELVLDDAGLWFTVDEFHPGCWSAEQARMGQPEVRPDVPPSNRRTDA
jgi:hypothetical protein